MNDITGSTHRFHRVLLLIVLPLIASLAGLFVYLSGGRYVETDNAYVKADILPVSAEVSGAVLEVLVYENEHVELGQLLFKLDPAPYQVAVLRDEAKLAQVRTDLFALKASYREKAAEIILARTRRGFALKEHRRQIDLAEKNYTAKAQLDKSEENAELAAQQILTLQEDLKYIAEKLGGNVDLPVESHPTYLAAQAELQQARLDLSYTEVRATLPGIVSKLPKPGQYVEEGQATMVVVATGRPWIEANFPENDLTHVQSGQSVTIRVDTYPGVVWRGKVESLSPATGAVFSIIPAQNATGNWVKIVQRLAVRIKLEEEPGKPFLRAGFSAIVEIDTEYHRKLFGVSF